MDLTKVELPAERTVSDTFRASNGLVLRLKKVSRILVADVGRKVAMPKVPVVYLSDKDRSEENPNDPDYLAAVQEAQYDRGMLTITTMLALGTNLEFVPEGMAPPDDEEWFEIIESIGITLAPGNKRLRYAAWLKYVALPDDDFNALIKELMRFSGLTLEEDVGEAEQAFRGETQRNGIAPNTVSAKGQPRNNNR